MTMGKTVDKKLSDRHAVFVAEYLKDDAIIATKQTYRQEPQSALVSPGPIRALKGGCK